MESLLKITSQKNPAVKLYRKLAGSRKARQQSGLLVLEGLRLVSDALRNGAQLTQLFWTEEGRARWNEAALPALSGSVPCALLPDTLGAALSQTEHSQGIYAICQMPRQLSPMELIRADGNYAVLYQLQDPGNAGMILRTADALGLDGVICCASCDVFSPKTVRATMGSLFRVPLCCVSSLEPVLTACRDRQVETCAAVLSGEAELVGRCGFPSGTAVLIGNEGNGLPEDASAACDRRITIPMYGTIESLNAAMAAGIILWEVQKSRRGEP